MTVSDRTGDLFGEQTIRDDFERALKAASCFRPEQLMYLDGGPFSGAVQITASALEGADLSSLADDDRRTVEGVRTLAHHLKLGGYAMARARDAGNHAGSDWAELLAYVVQRCEIWAEQVDHDGPHRCRTLIADRCARLLERSEAQEDHNDAYAMLRHLASQFPTSDGFRPAWLLRG